MILGAEGGWEGDEDEDEDEKRGRTFGILFSGHLCCGSAIRRLGIIIFNDYV